MVVSVGPFIFRRARATNCLARSTCVNRPSWKYPPAPAKSRTPPRATRSRASRSQRLRRRRFAPFHTDRLTPLSCSVPLLTASHPRVGAGNVSRPLLRVGPAIPPPTPTPAHGTHCPPFGRFAASAFGASACGAAASPRGFAASVSRPIFGSSAECTFPSPPFRFCSLCSARCLPAKSTS